MGINLLKLPFIVFVMLYTTQAFTWAVNSNSYTCKPLYTQYSIQYGMNAVRDMNMFHYNQVHYNVPDIKMKNIASLIGIDNHMNDIQFFSDTLLHSVPSHLKILSITAENATVAWVDTVATSWTVEYGIHGFTLGQGIMVTSNNTFFTIPNLLGNTVYDFYVTGIYSNGLESKTSRVGTFKTMCMPFKSTTLPYKENFDNYTTDVSINSIAPSSYPNHALPSCWNFLNLSGTSATYPQTFISSNPSYVISGKCLFFKSSATTPIYAVLPQIDVSIDSLLLTFAYRNEGLTSSNGTLSLGVMTNPLDPSSFIELETLPVTDVLTFTDHIFGNDTVTGYGYHIAFRYIGHNVDGFYVSLDELEIDYIPTCVKPSRLTIDSISAYTVKISWTSKNSNFIVDYKLSDDSTWTSITGILDTSITITGLQPACQYSVRERAICSATDSSSWSYVTTFYTDCAPRTVPYYENFESLLFPAKCWNRYQGLAPKIFDGTASLSPVSMGWSRTTSFNGLSTNHVKINVWGSGIKYWLVTPEIDLTNTIAELTFDLALTKHNDTNAPAEIGLDDKFMVIVSSDGITWAETDATIWSNDTNSNYIYRNIPNTAQQYTVSLSEYNGSVVRIAFYAESTIANSDNDLHIDNILVRPICTSPIITNVIPHETSAIAAWEGGYLLYQISYKEVDSSNWSELQTTTDSVYVFSNLHPKTKYDFRVRKVCGAQDTSEWSSELFETLELPCVAPIEITARNISYTTAAVRWTDLNQNQMNWKIVYGYNTHWDTLLVTTADIILTDLYPNTEYILYVMGYCNEGMDVHSDWSEIYKFRTLACLEVDDIVASEIKSNNAIISWSAISEQKIWELSYGTEGTDEENGTKITVIGTPSQFITDLLPNRIYDVYVRSVCDTGVLGSWSSKYQFKTCMSIGISSITKDSVHIILYPNPAKKETTIVAKGINGNIKIIISDINGRTVFEESLTSDNLDFIKKIPTERWQKGAYFVRLIHENYIEYRRLIIQ